MYLSGYSPFSKCLSRQSKTEAPSNRPKHTILYLQNLTLSLSLPDATSNGYAVDVSNNTALATAELIGLEEVDGRVKIAGDNLCYADTVNWDERIGSGQVINN